MKWLRRQGLSFKAALGIVITMVVVLGLFFVGLSQYFRSLLWQSEIQKTENINSIAQTLLIDSMMTGHKDTIQAALEKLGQNTGKQGIYSIAVYDDRFSLTAFASGFPGNPTIHAESMPSNVEDPSCWGCHKLPSAERPSHLVVNVEGHSVIRNSVPLYNEVRCQTCHGTSSLVLGDIIVDSSPAAFQRNYANVTLGLGVGLVIAVLLVTLVLFLVLRSIVLKPMGELVGATEIISGGNLEHNIEVRTEDEVGILAKAFNGMVSQLRGIVGSLEQRVTERTYELTLAAEVGRSVSQLRDLDSLLTNAAELIRSRFNLYYVQVYRTDASNKMLVLRAGTGGVGAELLRRGHRLPIGPGSINGTAAADRKPIIVVDTASDLLFRPNPLLPETRSEMSVPLQVGDRVVGVLDLQSRRPGELSEENITVFETLAGQLAIAMENAELFTQMEQTRHEMEEQSHHLTQAGWREFLNALDRSEYIGFLYDQENLRPFTEALPDTSDENTLKSSILVTGSSIGTVQLERTEDEPWQDDEMELVNAVVNQASRQLDNLRLLAQAENYRNDAEEAARRLTREGWVDYLDTKSELNSYVYNQAEVQPLAQETPDEESDEPAAAVVQPLKVGEEVVGEVAFEDITAMDETTQGLVANVADLLSGHIEGLRLTEQTQRALIETEDLYTAGSELNVAQSYMDILNVMRNHSLVGEQANVAMINLFNRVGSENDMPEYMEPVAVWSEKPVDEVTRRYLMADFPAALATLHPNYPALVEDVLKDNRLDEAAREFYFQQLQARGLLIVPLVAGGLWMGFIITGYSHPKEFQPEAVRRTVALAGQAVVAINNLRLLAETQALAQRETNLRQITALVRGSTDADTILRTATRELGTVLGRKVKVKLGVNKATLKSAGNPGNPTSES